MNQIQKKKFFKPVKFEFGKWCYFPETKQCFCWENQVEKQNKSNPLNIKALKNLFGKTIILRYVTLGPRLQS